MPTGRLQTKRYPVADPEEAVEFYFQQGWTDGLPIVPPTPARVERMLTGTRRDPAELMGLIPPNHGKATVEKIAINAVMAGCLPAYLPVVITAVQAITDPQFNLHGVQATTGPHSPLCIINGPIRQTLEINGGPNVFGPGWRANGTIGRAVKLIMLNLGGAKPGEIDKSTLGHPGKYTFCIGENEEESPWEPFHVEHGFAAGVSTVAVVAAEPPLSISDTTSRTARDLVATRGASLAVTWNARMHLRGQCLLVIGPEHAKTIAREGWTKADIKRFLYERVRTPLGELLRGPEWELGMSRQTLPAWLDTGHEHTLVPKFISPEEILIAVAGGTAGTHSACLSGWGNGFTSRMVIKPIEGWTEDAMADGLRERYEVLDPTDEAPPLEKKLASAVPDLQGKVIGFLDISKPKGDIFLKRLEELLTERYRVKAVMHRRKPTYTAPAPPSLREELASRCDAIIEALAD